MCPCMRYIIEEVPLSLLLSYVLHFTADADFSPLLYLLLLSDFF